ncbi:uncharacterized protein [Henckelia pumila]|uniref:uncharacterized protein n=1 Tax=Henckelia pumila TaxID=405737 RepID=UPI003C6DD42A
MDEIRRAYIKMGPYQPIKNEYPPTKFGSQNRRFQSHWFKKFTWLEYSPSKDAAFCFPCFLFEHKNPRNSTFTIDGFKYWKRVNDGDRCTFFMHIGSNTSPHNKAVEYLNNLMNIPCHIEKVINAQSSEEKQNNRLRLTATIESIQWLTLQACALRGHDESPASKNRGNFIEMIKFMGKMNESIGDIVLEKAPKNSKYTSPDIQKDILNLISNQGYDGASNMCGSWNGLQALFLRDCPCAYYVHCFAHRLQLALTAAADKELLVNVILVEDVIKLEIYCGLERLVGVLILTHFCSMIDMYSSVTIVLENMVNDGASNSIRGEASGLLTAMKSFDFVFILHLMQKIMGLTNLLCRSLQEKSLDILSAMDCVSTTKTLLHTLREEGFVILLSYMK